ncbi:MAG TPA: carbonic anhydrase [Polyangiales bacterium]|jgi:carbonic anhydrase|nr:carbonic anhydrase [Polyangiales bacterium]
MSQEHKTTAPTFSDDGSAFEDLGSLTLPAGGRFAILTCMDGRIAAGSLVGLPGSDAHIIRNAGARANEDAIRALVLSHRLLATREWYVVQHTHCGMALLNDESLGSAFADKHTHGDLVGSLEPGVIARLPIRDQRSSLVADVARIRSHPHVPAEVPIFGYLFDAESDRFYEIAEARKAGACVRIDRARSLDQSSDSRRSISRSSL